MNSNLFTSLLGTAGAPSKTAIVEPNASTYTYGDLIALSGRLASALVAMGIKPGDRVMTQLEKSVFGICLYLATLRAGAIYLPLNSAYTLSEVEYFANDAGPAIIVCEPATKTGLEGIARQVNARVETLDPDGGGSLMEAARQASPEFDVIEREPDDLAAILYTSGTTGRSKGAMLTHGNLLSNARCLIEAWRFTGNDILIHALPIYHTHGLFVATNVTLMSGASMFFLRKFDAEAILDLMDQATVLMGVPTFYVRLLQSNRLATASKGMRLFISGSAPLLAETHQDWQRLTGHAILERYGMTETNMNTSNPYDGDRVAGTVGRALPGVDVRVVDAESGKLLGVNDIGMIEVRGPNVFQGYWRMPEKTASEFRADGFFITGDLGKLDERGYLHILGRGKDLVITGGFNVYPKEIEEEIDGLEGVQESAVIGVPHVDFGEGVTAVVVRKKDSVIDEDTILTAITARLAKFKLPKRILFLDNLPRNTMGKVQKNLLREQFKDIYAPVSAGLPAKEAAGRSPERR